MILNILILGVFFLKTFLLFLFLLICCSDSENVTGKEDTTLENVPSPVTPPFLAQKKQPEVVDEDEDSDSDWATPVKRKTKETKRKYQKRKNKDVSSIQYG